jgi:hypothetical protein
MKIYKCLFSFLSFFTVGSASAGTAAIAFECKLLENKEPGFVLRVLESPGEEKETFYASWDAEEGDKGIDYKPVDVDQQHFKKDGKIVKIEFISKKFKLSLIPTHPIKSESASRGHLQAEFIRSDKKSEVKRIEGQVSCTVHDLDWVKGPVKVVN